MLHDPIRVLLPHYASRLLLHFGRGSPRLVDVLRGVVTKLGNVPGKNTRAVVSGMYYQCFLFLKQGFFAHKLLFTNLTLNAFSKGLLFSFV